jgi:hypothetical protein
MRLTILRWAALAGGVFGVILVLGRSSMVAELRDASEVLHHIHPVGLGRSSKHRTMGLSLLEVDYTSGK